jgi:hypothetical protein
VTQSTITVELSTEDESILGEINAQLANLDMNSGALRWQTSSTGSGSRYTVKMIAVWQRQEGQP